MGFSIGASQCLVAPPYAAAAIWMYVSAWFGDRFRTRGPLVAFNAILAIVGVCVLGFPHNLGGRYFGVFLAAMGSNANVPTSLTYQANNIRGHWKRAFCSATLVGWGGIGGIIGSLVFRSQDAPKYHPGLWACITSQLIILVIVLLLSVKFYFNNRRADRGEMIIEGIEGFRYTL
jgi:MFS transporter, ACS family, DAL5 transporter family protein